MHPIFQKFPAAASGAFLGETIRPEFGVGPVGSMPGPGLRSLLSEHGWKCQVDFKLLQVNETPYGPMQFTDGVQSWVNPRLVRP